MSVLKADKLPAEAFSPFRFAKDDVAIAPLPPAEMQAAQIANETGAKPSGVKKTVASAKSEAAQLRERVALLEKSLAEQGEISAKKVEIAREEGRKAGLDEAVRQDEERTRLLAQACDKTRSEAISAIEKQGTLAVEIARTTIAQILGDSSAYDNMVLDIVSHWRTRLSDSSIVRLSVSSSDFPHAGTTGDLEAALGPVEFEARDDLDSGSCVFQMRLGSVDASIPLQAARADELLERFGNKAVAQ